MTSTKEPSIYIGISSCLLGNEVRYDGGHRYKPYITEMLGQYFEFVPFCPEVAIGLGIPRPPIQLVVIENTVRARGIENPGADVTQALIEYAHSLKKQIQPLCGYIFKNRSPSCGTNRVTVYDIDGQPVSHSPGLFARTIMQDFPELPVEDEENLADPIVREKFIKRVISYQRQKRLKRNRPN